MEKKAYAIHLSDTTDISDLKPLGKALRNKRIVLLGESTHGSREMALLKNRLIRYLQQEHGFQVLLFESGMGAVFSLEQYKRELNAEKMLYSGLMGPWQSEAFIPLMEYLKTHPNLHIAGFDVQRSARSFSRVLQDLNEQLGWSGAEDLLQIEDQFSALRKKLVSRKTESDEALKQEKEKVIRMLTRAKMKLDEESEKLWKASWQEKEIDVIIRSLHNRIDFIDIYYQFKLDNNYVDRFTARDSVMAANVIWLAQHIYPEQKIIISAHNHHISRYNERDFVMGEKLAEVYGKAMYTIGLFPGEGSYANNSRQEEVMETSGKWNDLQQIILQTDRGCQFLPIPRKPKRGAEWLFQPITLNNTFINIWGDKELTLAESFDGLIFIRSITPSVYR